MHVVSAQLDTESHPLVTSLLLRRLLADYVNILFWTLLCVTVVTNRDSSTTPQFNSVAETCQIGEVTGESGPFPERGEVVKTRSF